MTQVYFYHAQAGGCCDCGDGGAWAPQGFCSKHGKAHGDPLANLEPRMVANARATLAATAQALLHVGQVNIAVVFQRTVAWGKGQAEGGSFTVGSI